MDQLKIDELIERIDHSLGEELPFSARRLTPTDTEVLQRVFGDLGYQDYLDDQANRQIIRIYLTNAVILGFLPERRIDAYSKQVGTREGRAALSLHILMSSVEDAANIPLDLEPENLKSLLPEPGSPPDLKLIRN
ncbi:MAG: hypothetical protein V7754_01790 [Halioglobus sp.]